MITTVKSWQVGCDTCPTDLTFAEGDWSEWTDEKMFNRGQLHAHLRFGGWTIGKNVVCPTCVAGGVA